MASQKHRLTKTWCFHPQLSLSQHRPERSRCEESLHCFPELYSIGIEGEVNEIVIALPQSRYQSATEDKKSVGSLRTLFQSSVVKLQKLAKSQSHSWDPSLDLCQLVDNIQIL